MRARGATIQRPVHMEEALLNLLVVPFGADFALLL